MKWHINMYFSTSVGRPLNISISHNVEFKGKPGANPDLLLLDKQGEIIERIDMGKYDREGCNQLLLDLGFWKKLQVHVIFRSKSNVTIERMILNVSKPRVWNQYTNQSMHMSWPENQGIFFFFIFLKHCK